MKLKNKKIGIRSVTETESITRELNVVKLTV